MVESEVEWFGVADVFAHFSFWITSSASLIKLSLMSLGN